MAQNEMHGHEAGHEAHPPVTPGRTLPVPVQGFALLLFGGALVLLLFVLPAMVGFAQTVASGSTDTPDSNAPFKPTDQQWAGLKVQRIVPQLLAPLALTDGRIALDDDLSTPVFSPYSGRVTQVFARAGDVVAAGAPLFSVQSTELAQAQNDMVSALGAMKTATAQLDLATANENRQRLLFQAHGAAQRDWQQSKVDLATAQGGLNSAEIAVGAVRNRLAILGLNPHDIHAIETAPNLATLSADNPVRAPIAGTITQRQINPGQNILGTVASAGAAAAVYTIGDLKTLWVVASAPEPDAAIIHTGDPVRISVPAYPGRVFEARVNFVSPVIDPTTHRLLVRAELANSDLALKPDMLAQFEIVTAVAAPTLAVPESAVVYEGADAHVWVADPATKMLSLRPITVGQVINSLVEVRSGLKPGESIVTSGAVFIDRTLSDN